MQDDLPQTGTDPSFQVPFRRQNMMYLVAISSTGKQWTPQVAWNESYIYISLKVLFKVPPNFLYLLDSSVA